jgi:hypothetical protein
MRLKTIDQHILDQQRKFPGVSGEFSGLLYDIALAAKLVSKEVNRAGLGDLLGALGEVNVQGEIVQKMDKFTNDLFTRILSGGGRVCAIATEENERIIEIREDGFAGKYAINMDPLDGSSNIDVNVSVGTIFSLHRKRSSGPRGSRRTASNPDQTGRRGVRHLRVLDHAGLLDGPGGAWVHAGAHGGGVHPVASKHRDAVALYDLQRQRGQRRLLGRRDPGVRRLAQSRRSRVGTTLHRALHRVAGLGRSP